MSTHFGHFHLSARNKDGRFDSIPTGASGCILNNDIHCFVRCNANSVRHFGGNSAGQSKHFEANFNQNKHSNIPILLPQIRSIGVTLVSCISWGLTFILIKIMPAFEGVIQLYGCIYAFAIFCIVNVIYVLVAVPETKGKSLDEILLILKVK